MQKHNCDDESGMESLQAIVIVAIAAVILGLLKMAWPTIRDWFSDWLTEIMR